MLRLRFPLYGGQSSVKARTRNYSRLSVARCPICGVCSSVDTEGTARPWESVKKMLLKHIHMIFLVMGCFMAALKIPIVPYFSGRKQAVRYLIRAKP